MTKRILFICTGNTCRSPMAESLLKLLAEQAGIQLDVRSAGVSAVDGAPVALHAAELLREKGARADGRSSKVSGDLIVWADLILTMTGSHKRMLLSLYPGAIDKTHTLKEYAGSDAESDARLQEREALAADLSIKQALGQPITPEERDRLYSLERQVPNPDIADPFGGSRDEYRRAAAEIETYLRRLLAKLSG